MNKEGWQNINSLNTRSFICWDCGDKVASDKGYYYSHVKTAFIYVCPSCGKPNFFDTEDQQTPRPLIGREIKNLPADICNIYKEIRDCIKNGNYTAATLLGRKLIMHLSVDIAGAKEGESFVKYVEYLKSSGFTPPKSESLLNYIKDTGNEKNHEIKEGTAGEAEKILSFIEVLLLFMYEFSDVEEIKDK
ncbi:MAG: DUF4145 domain-containing protein [Patescibacteria group bacterium]